MIYAFRARPEMVVVRADGPYDHDRSLETLQAVDTLRAAHGIPSLVWDARRRTSYPAPDEVRSLAPYLVGWSRVAIVAQPGTQDGMARMAVSLTSDRACVCRDTKRAFGWIRHGHRCTDPKPKATKVLLIDDDDSVRRTISRMLSLSGYEVVEAADGREGVAALERTEFSLVITDLLMPGVEGIETIQMIRDLKATIPIIAISGSFGDDNFSPLDDAKLMGADFAVEKPFSVETLLSAVQRVLGTGKP